VTQRSARAVCGQISTPRAARDQLRRGCQCKRRDHAHLAVRHPLPDIPVTAGLGGRPPAAPRKPHPTDRSGRGRGRRRSSIPPRPARHRRPAAPRSRSVLADRLERLVDWGCSPVRTREPAIQLVPRVRAARHFATAAPATRCAFAPSCSSKEAPRSGKSSWTNFATRTSARIPTAITDRSRAPERGRLLAQLGVTVAELQTAKPAGVDMPTVEQYLPQVVAATGPCARRTYGNYSARMAALWGDRRLDAIAATDIEALQRDSDRPAT
jgi:hypothetical protein